MSHILKPLLAVTLSFSILAASFTISPQQASAAAQQVAVKGTSMNVRSGPSTTNSVTGKIYKGQKYTVLSQRNGWYQVDLGKGKKGWLAGWLVDKVSTGTSLNYSAPGTSVNTTSGGTTLTVKGSGVNLRSGPGTKFATVGKAAAKETLVVKGSASGWYKVAMKNGKDGWIAGWLVTLNKTSPAVPPASGTKPVPGTNSGGSIAKTVVVKEPSVNIRSGPGTSYKVITKVIKGQELPVTSQSQGWYKVLLANKGQGWIAGWLINVKQKDVSRGDSGERPPDNQPTQPPVDPQTPNPPPSQPPTTQPPTNQEPQVPPQPPATVIDEVKIDITEDTYALRLTLSGNKAIYYRVESLDSSGVKIIVDKAKGGQDNLTVGKAGVDQVSYQTLGEPGQETMEINVGLQQGVRYFLKDLPGKKGIQVVIPYGTQILSGRTIVVDAGHGGIDPGAVGTNGLYEKNVAWNIVQLLKKELEAKGAEVILSRGDDTKVPLLDRAQIANNKGADIFVSIHANASTNRQTSGTATYYYAPSSLPQLYEQATQRKKLATSVQQQLVKALGRKDNGIPQGNFAVIRETLMPSILVETAFISNVAEEQLLADADFQARAAMAVAQGIENYFQQ